MFVVPPTAAQLATIGLRPEHYAADPPLGIWPENWQAFLVFNAVRTQWRTGPGGVSGLDYGALDRRIDRLDLSPEDLEACIQVMELAAMAQINDRD